MKYFKYYLNIFKMNIMDQLANRENFFVWILVHTISLVSMFIFFKLIYSQIKAINGWTEYQSLLVLGVGNLIAGLGSATFFSFMYSFGRDIEMGDYDLKLLKPLDAHFLAAFSWVDAEDLAAIPNSI
ncbi:MAG: ABC-2 family transporter protein, partial [bacterium]|nr:ABC-2 family transporter protein [bacterium]